MDEIQEVAFGEGLITSDETLKVERFRGNFCYHVTVFRNKTQIGF